jgi:hypothetical protein
MSDPEETEKGVLSRYGAVESVAPGEERDRDDGQQCRDQAEAGPVTA